MKKSNESDYCKKCGKKRSKYKTGLRVPAECHPPDEPYDGAYKEVIFRFCKNCDKKKPATEGGEG